MYRLDGIYWLIYRFPIVLILGCRILTNVFCEVRKASGLALSTPYRTALRHTDRLSTD